MMKELRLNSIFLSDQMYEYDGEMLFLSTEGRGLFMCDKNNEIHYISKIPSENIAWRYNNICFRMMDKVYCLPEKGDSIWIYDLHHTIWKRIKVSANSDAINPISQFKIKDQIAYLYAQAKRQIIELDINTDKIVGVWNFFDGSDYEDELGQICFYNEKAYIPSLTKNRLFELDVYEHKLLNVNKLIHSGGYFTCVGDEKGGIWLSGKRREIIRFDINTGDEIELMLPECLGEYLYWSIGQRGWKNPLELSYATNIRWFRSSLCLLGKIWFFPLFSNYIIYVDIDSKEIKIFNMREEEETPLSVIHRCVNGKFILEYIRDNRYIGIYSIKNETVIEIDAYNMTYKSRFFYASREFIEHMCKNSKMFSYMNESDVNDLIWFLNECRCKTYKFDYAIKLLNEMQKR